MRTRNCELLGICCIGFCCRHVSNHIKRMKILVTSFPSPDLFPTTFLHKTVRGIYSPVRARLSDESTLPVQEATLCVQDPQKNLFSRARLSEESTLPCKALRRINSPTRQSPRRIHCPLQDSQKSLRFEPSIPLRPTDSTLPPEKVCHFHDI